MKRFELIDARKEKKMSQGMLAKIVGVTPSAISGYERNVKNPSIQIAFKVADALNRSVENLWGKGYKTKTKKGLDKYNSCGIISKDMFPKNKLRDLRKQKGLTQKALADKANLSKNMIWLIEQKKRIPSITVAKKICKALKVNLDDIWGNGEE